MRESGGVLAVSWCSDVRYLRELRQNVGLSALELDTNVTSDGTCHGYLTNCQSTSKHHPDRYIHPTVITCHHLGGPEIRPTPPFPA